jgi:hypothetical protein
MDVDWIAVAKKMAEAARVKVAEDRLHLQELREQNAKRRLEQVSASPQ